MKKIILITVFLFALLWISTSYWATYERVWIANTDESYAKYADSIANDAENFLKSWSNDINQLRNQVNKTISSGGWWNWEQLSNTDYRYNKLARVEWNYLVLGCWNADLARIDISSNRQTNSTTSNWWSCSSHISSWSPSWSNCSVNGSWNSSWNITCSQTNNWSPNYSACWTTKITTTTSCLLGECTTSTSSSCSTSGCSNAPRPATQTATKTISMNLDSSSTEDNWAFANNSDSNSVTVNISGSTNQNKSITGWGNEWVFSNFSDNSWFNSDLINNSWNALNFSDVPNSVNIDWSWRSFSFVIDNIKSRTPFIASNWKIGFTAWSTPLVLNNVDYNFKKPFTWFIQTKSLYSDDWDWNTSLWTQMDYRLKLNPESSLDLNSLNNFSFNNFESEVSEFWDDIDIQNVSVDSDTLNSKDWARFTARVNSSEDASSLNQNPWIQIDLPYVNYSLDWQSIAYSLSKNNPWDDSTPVNTSWEEFLWVKILWNIQSDWKADFTWQNENFSDVTSLEARSDIREAAYNYISSMDSWNIVDWVKYVEGDHTISWNPDYETLVVKDWNVIINNNLNTADNTFWIIVLKDNYSVNSDYDNSWNIYITPNVTYISSILYSDWWIVSVDSNNDVYSSDNSSRTYALKNQLVLKWAIFTRNTIGWAVLAWGQYVLPGWSMTDNYDLAMQYDLNYIRRGSQGWDKNSNDNLDSWEYMDAFIINYDSRVQSNPPKLFN